MSDEADNTAALIAEYIAASKSFRDEQAAMEALHKRAQGVADALSPKNRIGEPTIYNQGAMRQALEQQPSTDEIVAAVDKWIAARMHLRKAYAAMSPDAKRLVVSPPRAVGV